jgi:hypothetical protein
MVPDRTTVISSLRRLPGQTLTGKFFDKGNFAGAFLERSPRGGAKAGNPRCFFLLGRLLSKTGRISVFLRRTGADRKTGPVASRLGLDKIR